MTALGGGRRRAIDRLLARVVAGENNCWIWTGYVSRGGYGRVHGDNKKQEPAHRVAYEHFVGPVPKGLQLDHLCRVRRCVNPAHLEAVTGRVNTLRGESPHARYARRTHCKNGHPYTGENFRWAKRGKFWWRQCLICRRNYKRIERARGLAEGDHRHGTLTGYWDWSCRCPKCKAAFKAEYHARKATDAA